MTTQTLVRGADAGQWDRAIYAFLAEKERRSGSMRTVRANSGMLYRFFGALGIACAARNLRWPDSRPRISVRSRTLGKVWRLCYTSTASTC